MIKDFIQGFTAFATAHKIINKYHLWSYLILPGLLSVAYVLLLIILGSIYFSEFSAYITENWLPDFMTGSVMIIITDILLWILLLLTGYMTYKHVVLIIFSPILSHLSEKVEQLVFSQPAPAFSINHMINDIIRSLLINSRNLWFTIIFSLLSLLLIFIPVIGAVASTIFLFLIQSYYGGFGLIDYTLERKRFSVKDSIQFAKTNKALVNGIGSGFMILLLIPVVGWFLAPAYGTVTATIATLEKLNLDK